MNIRTLLNIVSALVLFAGLGVSVWLYQNALKQSEPVLGYEEGDGAAYPVSPQDSKIFQREMERYGGKANLLAYELRTWFSRLWHGKSLALIIGCVSVLASFACYYAANHLPLRGGHAEGEEDDSTRNHS